MKKSVLAALSAFLMAGCATTSLPPITSPNFTPEEDEKRIWLRSQEEEKKINDSGLVYKDRELEEYLNGIGRKLQPAIAYQRIPFKILVLKNPYSNAFAYPNGVIYLHTGILSRMDNEAQLATLLAHEMTHATHRHQLQGFRSLQNKTAFFASMRSTVGSLPAVGELTNVLGDIGAAAAITGHSRDLETEADTEGLRLMIHAGYNPREAPKLFHHIRAELEEEGTEEPFFFGSHPRLKDRVDNYEQFLKDLPDPKKGVDNADIFRRKVAGAILDNASLDLKAGRFKSAQRGTAKYISVKPRDARGHYLMGEIFRQRADRGDMQEAKEYFQKSISLDASYPEPHKGIGLLYFKSGQKVLAEKAFRSYLRLAPKASDRSYIEDYLAQCK
jgi:predicted Zn-dependent protease